MNRSPGRILSIVITGLGLLLAGCGPNATPSIANARAAYSRNDWNSAASLARNVLDATPTDATAQRILGRALVHLDRPDEAIPMIADSDSPRFPVESEDLILLSRAFFKNERPLLSSLALESALKLTPGDRAASAERSRKSPPSERLARFGAIPSGAAFAELVIVLATIDGSSSEPGPILAALLRKDRSVFAGLVDRDAVRKLIARIALESGDPSLASRQLEAVQQSDDAETGWLLSRVQLLMGREFDAHDYGKQWAKYRSSHALAHEPGRYAGAASCAGCHSAIHASQQSSLHSRTLSHSEQMSKVPLPSGPITDPVNPAVSHTFHRDGNEIQLKTRVGDTTVSALLDYALGSGHLGITMLARDPGGKHRSLRLSYYKGGDHWGLTTGFEPSPTRPENYLGELLSEEAFVRCINCHATRFVADETVKGPEWADHGIGCERCHGPGENHIKAVESNFPDISIARPKLATPERRFGVCVECHGADGVIPPSDPRFIRFQGAVLPYSRCYLESGKKLDCVSCHSPHRNLETRPEYYESRCLACHSGRPVDPSVAARLRIESVSASVCKVDATQGCVTCHMPKVDDAMPFTKFTDHHIRVHHSSTTGTKVTQ